MLAATGLAAFPAHAGEAGKAPEADKPAAKSGTAVDMPILVAPLVVDGKLTAYAYIHSTIQARSSSAVLTIRDKTPFLQDAFIRDVNGEPIVDSKDPAKVDKAALQARLLADVRRVVGADKVTSLAFTQLQVAPLRPDVPQTSQ